MRGFGFRSDIAPGVLPVASYSPNNNISQLPKSHHCGIGVHQHQGKKRVKERKGKGSSIEGETPSLIPGTDALAGICNTASKVLQSWSAKDKHGTLGGSISLSRTLSWRKRDLQ